MASCTRFSLCSARLRPKLHRLHSDDSSRSLSLPAAKDVLMRGAQHSRYVSTKASDSSGPTDGSSTAVPWLVIPKRQWRLQGRPPVISKETFEGNRKRKIDSAPVQEHLLEEKTAKAKSLELLEKLTTAKSLWDSNLKPFLSPILLRDSCRCDQCIDPSTKQRSFSFHDIPGNVRALEGGKTDDGRFIVNWENDIDGFVSHTSTFSLDELEAIVEGESMSMIPDKEPPDPWDSTSIAERLVTMSYEDYMTSDKHLLTFVKALQRDGLGFVKGVPPSTESVNRIVERIGPIRNTFYGSTWDVKSKPEAENVAYTDKELGFHMDLLYMKLPPKYQFLHCVQNTCTGGESRFLDIQRARRIMTADHPDQAQILKYLNFRYHYENMGHTYMSFRPVFGKPQTSWWSPPFVDAFQHRAHTLIGMPTSLSAVKVFASILDRKDLVHQTKMEEGTCAIFENTRVLHARNAFDVNSGHRWLRGAYLDGQPLNSTYIRLMREEAATMDSMA
jgi:alpha-ketoglutarate-dependent taurine dioxygenase